MRIVERTSYLLLREVRILLSYRASHRARSAPPNVPRPAPDRWPQQLREEEDAVALSGRTTRSGARGACRVLEVAVGLSHTIERKEQSMWPSRPRWPPAASASYWRRTDRGSAAGRGRCAPYAANAGSARAQRRADGGAARRSATAMSVVRYWYIEPSTRRRAVPARRARRTRRRQQRARTRGVAVFAAARARGRARAPPQPASGGSGGWRQR